MPDQPGAHAANPCRMRAACFVLFLLALIATLPRICQAQTPSGNELLGSGVNYGNMLEAPREGDWGVRFDDDYPRLIKDAGFRSVRLPVCWSAHTAATKPFRVEADFLARVKHVVECNLAQGLNVVLNVHHFDELFEDPDGQKERFIALWEQIAEQFREADERVFFELLNEPHGKLSGDRWNDLLAETLEVIRHTHPRRWVIVGPDNWNNVQRLPQLKLPEQDRRLIATVHYYLPITFTHQGASWVRPTLPVGKKWDGKVAEIEAIRRHFDAVARWSKQHDRPVYLGEFGAYDRADMDSRVRWTREVRRVCEESGFAWSYWELAAGFGILDPNTNQWRAELLQALVTRSPAPASRSSTGASN